MNRTLLLGSAWAGSAAVAVGLGFLAVSLVDASATPPVRPASTGLAAGADDTSSPAPTTSASPAPAGEQATPGGTVYATCAGGSPVLAGAPVAGWSVDDSPTPGQVEFTSASQSIEVDAVCVGGSPRFSVEGPRPLDRSGGGSGGSGGGGATTAAPSAGAPDDSSGRVGGGHGADDPVGDDSSGRGGGGHGSDD